MASYTFVGPFDNTEATRAVGGTYFSDDGNFIRRSDLAQSLSITCHQATYIWLYRAAHGVFPSLDLLVGAQTVVNDLIRLGHPTRVTSSTRPTTGDVLIFVDPDRPFHGLHSCITRANGLIGGYNQADWMQDGAPGQYTEHAPSRINWVPTCCFSAKETEFHGDNYRVWAVRGDTAVVSV